MIEDLLKNHQKYPVGTKMKEIDFVVTDYENKKDYIKYQCEHASTLLFNSIKDELTKRIEDEVQRAFDKRYYPSFNIGVHVSIPEELGKLIASIALIYTRELY